jgi:plasmid stabilization system protein ParE
MRGHDEVEPRRLVWSDKARRDFREIIAYIAERNPVAAASVADRIDQSARNLAAMPTGRRGRVSGTSEKPIQGLPYVLAYALEATEAGDEVLAVLRVIHGGRATGVPKPGPNDRPHVVNCACCRRKLVSGRSQRGAHAAARLWRRAEAIMHGSETGRAVKPAVATDFNRTRRRP